MNPTTTSPELLRRACPALLATLMSAATIGLTSCGKKGEAEGGTSEAQVAEGGSVSQSAGVKGTAAPKPKVEPDLPPLDHPASPAEAARYVNLGTLPAMEGAEGARQQTVANMSYRVSAPIKDAYDFHKKQLLAQKWKELAEGTSVTDQYASGVFERVGFHVSLMVNPSGEGSKVDVTLHNHGNVDLSKLPLPAGTTKVYAGPITLMHAIASPVDATAAECRKLLTAQGWEPYGSAGDTVYFRRNGVMLQLNVTSAPAQGGKTMITYLSEQMSAEIPAPADAEDLRYNDSQRKLEYATTSPKEAVSGFYKEALGKSGWKPNKDEWFRQDDKDVLVFRSPSGDMLWTEFQEAGGKSRVSLAYQTGAEIEEMNRKMDAQAEAHKAKLKADLAKPVITLALPADTSIVSQAPNEVKLTVNAGFAKVAADAWNDKLHETGWLLSSGTSEGGAGVMNLRREGQTMTIQYDDSNRNPAPLSVSTTGVGVEVK